MSLTALSHNHKQYNGIAVPERLAETELKLSHAFQHVTGPKHRINEIVHLIISHLTVIEFLYPLASVILRSIERPITTILTADAVPLDTVYEVGTCQLIQLNEQLADPALTAAEYPAIRDQIFDVVLTAMDVEQFLRDLHHPNSKEIDWSKFKDHCRTTALDLCEKVQQPESEATQGRSRIILAHILSYTEESPYG